MSSLLRVIQMVRQMSMVHPVNDTPLVSRVKDTDRPTVWSDGPRNKYDPGVQPALHLVVKGVGGGGLKGAMIHLNVGLNIQLNQCVKFFSASGKGGWEYGGGGLSYRVHLMCTVNWVPALLGVTGRCDE